MHRSIDYYFSLVSPWAYIGHATFINLTQRHGLDVNFKPVSLPTVLAETGGLPLNKRAPARQRYRIMELQRWREKRRVRLNLHPKFWPFNVETADHLTVAIVESGAIPDQFLRKAFPGVRADERNLADEQTLMVLADDVGLPAQKLLADVRVRTLRRGTSRISKRHWRSKWSAALLRAPRRGVLGPGPHRVAGQRIDIRT